VKQEDSGIVREVSNCRICGCSDLVKYLDLVVDFASTADFSAGGGKYIISIPAFKIIAPDGEA